MWYSCIANWSSIELYGWGLTVLAAGTKQENVFRHIGAEMVFMAPYFLVTIAIVFKCRRDTVIGRGNSFKERSPDLLGLSRFFNETIIILSTVSTTKVWYSTLEVFTTA